MSDYPKCTYELRKQGVPYPRTCAECGLGPCKEGHFTPAPKLPSEAESLRADLASMRASRDALEEALKRLVDRDLRYVGDQRRFRLDFSARRGIRPCRP
jgi:hypothetical protein